MDPNASHNAQQPQQKPTLVTHMHAVRPNANTHTVFQSFPAVSLFLDRFRKTAINTNLALAEQSEQQ